MSSVELHLGDCLEGMKDLDNGSADMIFTDPPYRTISGGTSSKLASGWKTSVLHKNDGKIFEHNNIEIEEYMPELYRILKDGGDCYVMTNNINIMDLLNVADKCGFKFHNLLLWIKNTCTANRWYMKNVEYVCYFYKSPARRINDASSKQTFCADNPTDKSHPTEKPTSLVRHYILNSTDENDIVVDPFFGSGATAVACAETDRNFIGYEIDPDYYEIAKRRVHEAQMQPRLI